MGVGERALRLYACVELTLTMYYKLMHNQAPHGAGGTAALSVPVSDDDDVQDLVHLAIAAHEHPQPQQVGEDHTARLFHNKLELAEPPLDGGRARLYEHDEADGSRKVGEALRRVAPLAPTEPEAARLLRRIFPPRAAIATAAALGLIILASTWQLRSAQSYTPLAAARTPGRSSLTMLHDEVELLLLFLQLRLLLRVNERLVLQLAELLVHRQHHQPASSPAWSSTSRCSCAPSFTSSVDRSARVKMASSAIACIQIYHRFAARPTGRESQDR